MAQPREGSAVATFLRGAGKGRLTGATSGPAQRMDVGELVRNATSGKRPTTPQRSASGGSHSPAQVEADIRKAYHDEVAASEHGSMVQQSGFVSLADIRDRLGEKHSRADVDAALTRMLRADAGKQEFRLIPVMNRKSLKPRDREAALQIGVGEPVHAMQINAPSKPEPSAPSPSNGSGKHPPTPDGVRAAYEAALAEKPAGSNRYVPLSNVRKQLGGTRAEQDKALLQLAREPDIDLIPEENQKVLTQAERDGALSLGNHPVHLMIVRGKGMGSGVNAAQLRGTAPATPAVRRKENASVRQAARQVHANDQAGAHLDRANAAIRAGRHAEAVNHLQAAETAAPDKATKQQIADQRRALSAQLMGKPAPAKKAAAPKKTARQVMAGKPTAPAGQFAPGAVRRLGNLVTPTQAVQALSTATTREQVRERLAGATKDDLIQILNAAGGTYLKSASKAKLLSNVVDLLAGRRLDSEAIDRMVRGR